MKKLINFILLLFIFTNLFADDIFPSFKKKMNAENNLSLRYEHIASSNKSLLKIYYKDLESKEVDILAVKSKNAKMDLIIRHRQLGPTNNDSESFTEFYLISIDKNGKATSKMLKIIPDLTGFYYFNATVNENRVNFRDEPNLKGNVKGQYQKNTTLEFMGKLDGYIKIGTDSDYWYNFNYNGTEKWIFGRWISFPTTFELNPAFFNKPQELKKEEVKEVVNSESIKKLPFENTKNSVNRIDIYKAGTSELQIIYDSDSNRETCKIIKDNEVISVINNPENPVYSPKTKCLYYKERMNTTLNAVNIETGKAVSLIDKTLKYSPDEIYLNDLSVFALNENKDKLFYIVNTYDVDDLRIKVLESIDLITMEHKKIKLISLDKDFPNYRICNFCIIDDNNFYIVFYNYQENKTGIVAWYAIEKDALVLKSQIKFIDVYADLSEFFNAGTKVLFSVNGRNMETYNLSIKNNTIEKEKFEGGDFSNTFVYDGVEYFATVKADQRYAPSYTVFIYETKTGKEVIQKTFTPLNKLWGIRSVSVANGKILVEDIVEK